LKEGEREIEKERERERELPSGTYCPVDARRRLSFPGYLVPAFQGNPVFLQFPFPGKMAGNPGKSNEDLFY
jgi:hypothetical protein